MKVRSWSVTDVGRVRQKNEDAYSSRDDLGLYVVCDGMGGHQGGQVASRIATETIVKHVEKSVEEVRTLGVENRSARRRRAAEVLAEAIQDASAAIWKMASAQPELRGMGCTAVCLWLLDNDGVVGHVGDSRLDLIRDGTLFHLTEDHTLYQLHQRTGLSNNGQRVPKNVLTRAVGIQSSVQVDTVTLDLLEGDQLVLCSDGLHNYLADDELAPILAQDPLEPARKLVDLANERGGKDNITVIVISVGGAGGVIREEVRNRLEAFRKMPLFHYFSFKQLMSVSGVSETLRFNPGDVIFKEGAPGSDLFILISGQVSVTQGQSELARLGPGGHFGEMGLVDDSPRSASVHCLSAVTCAVVTRDGLMDLLRQDPPLAVKLLWSFVQTLSTRLRSVNQHLIDTKRFLDKKGGSPNTPNPFRTEKA